MRDEETATADGPTATSQVEQDRRPRSEERTTMTIKAEQETILRWDQDERVLHLYTAYPLEAKKWARLGYTVEVCGRTQAGEPRGWQARAPLEALRLRRLVDGQVVKRRGGVSNLVKSPYQGASEPRPHRDRPPGTGRPGQASDASN